MVNATAYRATKSMQTRQRVMVHARPLYQGWHVIRPALYRCGICMPFLSEKYAQTLWLSQSIMKSVALHDKKGSHNRGLAVEATSLHTAARPISTCTTSRRSRVSRDNEETLYTISFIVLDAQYCEKATALFRAFGPQKCGHRPHSIRHHVAFTVRSSLEFMSNNKKCWTGYLCICTLT